MKKIFIVLSILMVIQINIGFSQNNDYKLLELKYSNSQGEEGITYFNYNWKGSLDRSLWQLVDGSRNSVNFYSYDTQNRLIKKNREFSDGLKTEECFIYDDEGSLIKESFRNSKGITGETNHYYDNEKKLIKSVCKGDKGWFYGTIIYKYSKNGLKVKGEITKDDLNMGQINYSYNNTGLLEKEVWDFSNKWSQTFSYHYQNKMTTQKPSPKNSNIYLNFQGVSNLDKEYYSFGENETTGVSSFKYDDLNRICEKTYLRSDGVTTKTYFFYDLNNVLVKSLRVYQDKKSGIFSYRYDKNNNLVERNYLDVLGNKGSEKYFYKNNQLFKAELKNFDNWISGIIEYKYKDNKLVSGTFKEENKKFDAQIFFLYNQNSLLKSIEWKFSFNKSQEYKFEYEK